MNNVHVLAVLSSLIFYLMLSLAYFGWGRLIFAILQLEKQKPKSLTSNLWLGWVFSLLSFQIIHFFFPMNAYSVVPVFLIGMFLSGKYILQEQRGFVIGFLKKYWGSLLLLLFLSVWVTSRAMLPSTDYDSGLYHFGVIKWTNSFSIIPGLGNLHGRFAFNQSFLTYVAALNISPFFNYGRSLANSFLLLLLFGTLIEFLRPLIKQSSLTLDLHPFRYVPSLIIFPYLIYLALSSSGLASPSADLASTLLQLLMFVVLANVIGEWVEGESRQNSTAIFLVALAATAVTIKLSSLVFSIAVILIVLLYVSQVHKQRKLLAVYVLLPACIIIITFLIRGYILSGVPLYPSTMGYGLIPVDWAVPKESIISEANWVYSWARAPGVQPEEVLGNWRWFKPWLNRIVDGQFMEVVYPLILTMLVLYMMLALSFVKKVKKLSVVELFVLLPSLAGLLFWFFMAPNVRFANAVVFLLFLSSLLLLITSIRHCLSNKALIFILGLALFVSSINLFKYHTNISRVSVTGWHPIKVVPTETKITQSGLEVYSPTENDQCWDEGLPCTPLFKNNLQLRVKGDFSSGFIVKGQE